MAEQHIRDLRIGLMGGLQQPVCVRNCRKPPSVEISFCLRLPYGAAVAHVVLGHHQVAKAVQITGKFIVTLYILGNAVNDLHDAPDFPVRKPAAAMQLPPALGRIVKVFHQSTTW